MKIFLCSTAYDLEDFRALIVHRHGTKHDIIHFEDAAFPARRGLHSHDQCTAAVNQADVMICIIDKRYGGLYRGNDREAFCSQKVSFKATKGGEEQKVEIEIPADELSISWCELITAFNVGKFVITFARQRTLDEKATRRKNQDVEDFRTTHVDSPRVFDLLDWITKQRKDNWIIPFTSIVDFESKLEKWLEAADQGISVSDSILPSDVAKPITIVTEGFSDREVVRAVINTIHPNAPVNIISAHSKHDLLNNLKQYAIAFHESCALIVLMDADTTSLDEIEEQKKQFEVKTASITEPKVHLVLTKPTIEEWLVSGLGEDNLPLDDAIKKVKIESRNRQRRKALLSHLREHLDDVRKLSNSLDSFVQIVNEVLSTTKKEKE